MKKNRTSTPAGIYRLRASEMDPTEREGGVWRLPGVVLGGEGTMEAREAGDEVLHGRRDGRRPEERRHDEEERGGHGSRARARRRPHSSLVRKGLSISQR